MSTSQPRQEDKHEVYECRKCKSHYLTLNEVTSHIHERHSVKWQHVFSMLEKVPFGATDFDTTRRQKG
jgi:hypothetical protein